MLITDSEEKTQKMIIVGILVYIATVYLSGTEEPSPSCHRLPHKH